MFIKTSERGQALILITFAIIGLIGLTGLTVDGGMAYSDRRNAQNAADSAAFAAARAKIREENYQNAIYAIANMNGYPNSAVAIAEAPAGANICGDGITGTEITVTITSSIDTSFASVVGVQHVTNVVSATSRACDIGASGPLYAGSAVFSTKTGACNGANSSNLYVNGSGHLQVWGGDLASASADPSCLNFQGGETQLKKQESGTECADIVTAASSGGTFNNVKGEDGCGAKIYNQTFADPPANLNITCSGTATKTGESMSPGNFTGTFPPAGVKTLESGTYCLNGDFRLNNNEKLTGNGVTIVLNTGTLKWNGSSEIKLSAPTEGAYKGLLIYAPPTNSHATGNNEINIDGNGNAKLTGTVLAQNLPCYFAGSGQIQKAKLQFICYTWGMNGNGQGEIVYDSSVFYSPIVMPNVSLIK
ncbi:MAG: hypothetical protein C4557_08580 [Anaerolineaceae bacterium]|jgi:Flp pilus assembly protein TadG|nr:MAG: hypothetical protein C4557_08580 [Anaerolineaceae bacterium]